MKELNKLLPLVTSGFFYVKIEDINLSHIELKNLATQSTKVSCINLLKEKKITMFNAPPICDRFMFLMRGYYGNVST